MTLKKYDKPLKGIAHGLKISGEGIVEYQVKDEDGNEVTLRMKAYYVPNLDKSMRLVCSRTAWTTEGNPVNLQAPTYTEGVTARLDVHDFSKGPNWIDTAPIQRLKIQYNPRHKLPSLKHSLIRKERRTLRSWLILCVLPKRPMPI